MALKNSDGNYLKIERVNFEKSVVICKIYRDESARQSPSDFDRTLDMSYDVSSSILSEGESFVSTGNIFDDVKKVGYSSLKHEPPFNGDSGETWIDC